MRFTRMSAESLDVLMHMLNALFDNGLDFTIVTILYTKEGVVAVLDFYETNPQELTLSA